MVERIAGVKITCAEAARLLGVSPRTLERWRRDRTGPKFFKQLGSRPFYLLSDIELYRAGGCVETMFKKPAKARASPRGSAEQFPPHNSCDEDNPDENAPGATG